MGIKEEGEIMVCILGVLLQADGALALANTPLRLSTFERARQIEIERMSVDDIDGSQVEKDPLARVLSRDGHVRVPRVSSKVSKSNYKGLISGSKQQQEQQQLCSLSLEDLLNVIRTEISPAFREINGEWRVLQGQRWIF